MTKKPRVRIERLAPLLRASADRERLIVTGVLITVNVYGLAAMFSDCGPMEPTWLRTVTIVILFVLGGAVVGVLLPKKWLRRHRKGHGRPAVPSEVRQFTRRMSQANSLWGAPRVHGALPGKVLTWST